MCTVEFYAAINTKEIMKSSGKLMDLENIILEEVSQSRKTNTVCSIPYADPSSNCMTCLS